MSQPIRSQDVTEVLDSLLLAWRRITPSDGLSRTAAATLGALDRLGPLRITALAEHEAVSQPAMTGLVGRLEAQCLVNRTADPDDGRAVLIGLTPRGESVVAERRHHYADTIDAMVRDLPSDDFDRLAAALPAVRRLAEAAHNQTTTPAKDPR